MSVKKTFLIVAMAITLCACQKENKVETYAPDPGEIQLNMIHPGVQTRVTDTGFDADDKIGV